MENKESKTNWDVTNYSLDDLLDILNISPDPTTIQVTDRTNDLIARMRSQGRIEETKFIEQAKDKILAAFHEDTDSVSESDDSQSDDEQNDGNTYIGNWWKNQYPSQEDINQANKATSRNEKIQVYPNSHQQMNRERLGINQSYDVPVIQGTLNPHQRNITQQIVFIDSSQKPNLTKSESKNINTDFTLDLSEPLTNVLRMKLNSIHVPNTWLTFSLHLGNTTFNVTFFNKKEAIHGIIEEPSGRLKSFSKETVYAKTCTLHSLNYTVSDLADKMNFEITHRYKDLCKNYPDQFQNDPIVGDTPYFITVDSSNSNKIQFHNNLKSHYIKYTFNSSDIASNSIFNNQNLGWSLGLRDLQTIVDNNGIIYRNNSDNSFVLYLNTDTHYSPPALVDTYGPKSLFLVIDDYNQNRQNKSVISISDYSTKVSIPEYIGSKRVNKINRDILDISSNVIPTYPRRLTQAQIYTANQIISSKNTSHLYLPPVPSDNVLAIIPLVGAKKNEPFIVTGNHLLTNERTYFGPVNIERMRIKLMDDKGNLLDLQNMDWSFSILIEQLYQY